MPFIRQILEELHCPRCNAWAQLRIEEERDTACVVYIVCGKCKLYKYHGLTTRRAVMLKERERKLLLELDSALTELSRNRIRGKIEKVRDQIVIANLGIGG